jgi:hypothetical protein
MGKLRVICPRCMVDGATISVDLDDGEALRCHDCDETYSVTEVRELIASWGPLLVWLDLHPSKTAK